jgi:hypothetical protein
MHQSTGTLRRLAAALEARDVLLAAARMAYDHMEPFGENKHVVSVLALAIARAEELSETHDMFKIFDKLGGEKKSLDIIEKAEGKRPSGYARELWRKQRRIPAIRAVLLLDECTRRGIAATYASADATKTNEGGPFAARGLSRHGAI